MWRKDRFEDTLSVEEVARAFRLSDVAWGDQGRSLYWLEGRSDRSVLMTWERGAGFVRDLTRDWSVRARVGYGGGDFSTDNHNVYFAEGNRIFRQRQDSFIREPILESTSPLCSPTVSPDGRWLLVIESGDPRDRLLLVPSSGGSAAVLFDESHFCMQPAWDPAGQRVTWVAWEEPWMPWQNSRALVADLEIRSGPPRLTSLRELRPGNGKGRSVFQPTFSPDGNWIANVDDGSGWSNLQVFRSGDLSLAGRFEEEAEHAPPAWLQGMRSYGWLPDSSGFWLVRSSQGRNHLMLCSRDFGTRDVLGKEVQDFTFLSQPAIHPSGDRAGLIGSSASHPPCILVCDRSGKIAIVRRSLPDPVLPGRLSSPRPVDWTTPEGPCHGLFWPPVGPPRDPGKAVIKVHGGPHSQAVSDFDPDTHFFTSRGYSVLDVNYRGSTGYGRSYRRALDGKWGIADVEDIARAADYLVEQEGIDPRRVVLSGGSAGGFTILLALARFPGRFRAAVCRYAVTDLFALQKETDKFERRYLDTLIGPLDEARSEYERRSPLSHAGKIVDPVAIFQGAEDKVVPPSQSRVLAELLGRGGTVCRYKLFSGEGHGWRRTETIREYYALVEAFLQEQLPDD